MKKSELNTVLNSIQSKLYEFSYIILPDDLQAQQLVIDATTAFILKEQDWLNITDYEEDERKERSLVKFDVYKLVLKNIFEIGVRRFTQLSADTLVIDEQFKNFYELDVISRALLFLKHKTEISFNDILEITQMKKPEVLAKIYTSRQAVINAQM